MPSHGPFHGLFSSLVHRDDKEKAAEDHAQEPKHKKETTTSIEDEDCSKTASDLDKIIRYLQTENWNFSVERERQIILTSATGDNGTYRIILDLKEEAHILIVYVYLPSKVPLEKRLQVAEYITRANYGLVIGNFELDFKDGEVRYKGSLEYADGDLPHKMMDQLIQKCAYTMNRYFPGLMRVIFGDVEALDAIRQIEPNQAGGAALALARVLEGLPVDTSSSPTEDSSQVVVATPADE